MPNTNLGVIQHLSAISRVIFEVWKTWIFDFSNSTIRMTVGLKAFAE